MLPQGAKLFSFPRLFILFFLSVFSGCLSSPDYVYSPQTGENFSIVLPHSMENVSFIVPKETGLYGRSWVYNGSFHNSSASISYYESTVVSSGGGGGIKLLGYSDAYVSYCSCQGHAGATRWTVSNCTNGECMFTNTSSEFSLSNDLYQIFCFENGTYAAVLSVREGYNADSYRVVSTTTGQGCVPHVFRDVVYSMNETYSDCFNHHRTHTSYLELGGFYAESLCSDNGTALVRVFKLDSQNFSLKKLVSTSTEQGCPYPEKQVMGAANCTTRCDFGDVNCPENCRPGSMSMDSPACRFPLSFATEGLLDVFEHGYSVYGQLTNLRTCFSNNSFTEELRLGGTVLVEKQGSGCPLSYECSC